MPQANLGVAIAKRTGERRVLTVDEYLELDDSSEARWEFFGFTVDPETGEPSAEEMKQFGFAPGGPTVIPGEYVETAPGCFERTTGDQANPRE
ncbi:MAG TPA: hypothetical protein VF771_17645 [Longimicrobiaceae bacterium]